MIILRADGAVFLVKHSYMKGWYFPGGGVERGEAPQQAARREMREEAKMVATGEPALLGLYFNHTLSVPDYIACYIVRDWRWDSEDGMQPPAASEDGEIIDAGFFSFDRLPQDVTPATRARLEELFENKPASDFWAPI
ncbi:NUDIX domain-containing protein [uncultured Cohaesibacter sp.]|uniref:NUDIX domain-containing protein n=1 Tax=uncultured Cohaesibacter sp. TaxID=1002546 RepID=UPI00292D4515